MDLKIRKITVAAPVELHGDWCEFSEQKNCHLGTYADSLCRVVNATFTVYVDDWTCVGEVDFPRAKMKRDAWEQRCHEVAMAVRKQLAGVTISVTNMVKP